MPKRSLLPLGIVGLLLIVILDAFFSVWSHHQPYFRKLRSIESASEPNLLLLGNSLLEDRVDETLFVTVASERGKSFRPVNTALGGIPPQEQRLLFEYALYRHPHIRTLVVGIFDFQLTTEDHTRPWNVIGNGLVAIDPAVPISEVADAYNFGRLDLMQVRVLRALPFLPNRVSAWKAVELLRRSMGEIGMPHAQTTDLGRASDFAYLEAAATSDFDDKAYEFLQHPNRFNSSYEYTFQHGRSAGIDPVIVIMPMSPFHRAKFYRLESWTLYRAALIRLASERGIRVIDASDWLPLGEYFDDNLHMSRTGVTKFSERLGRELAENPVLERMQVRAPARAQPISSSRR
jgi:hypothetical protein